MSYDHEISLQSIKYSKQVLRMNTAESKVFKLKINEIFGKNSWEDIFNFKIVEIL